jgi:hypothetical protein
MASEKKVEAVYTGAGPLAARIKRGVFAPLGG